MSKYLLIKMCPNNDFSFHFIVFPKVIKQEIKQDIVTISDSDEESKQNPLPAAQEAPLVSLALQDQPAPSASKRTADSDLAANADDKEDDEVEDEGNSSGSEYVILLLSSATNGEYILMFNCSQVPSKVQKIKRRKSHHHSSKRTRSSYFGKPKTIRPAEQSSSIHSTPNNVAIAENISGEKAKISILLAVRELFPELKQSKCRDLCSCTATFLQTMGKYFVESSSSVAATPAPSKLFPVEAAFRGSARVGESPNELVDVRRAESAGSEQSSSVNIGLNIDKSIYYANPKYRQHCAICDKKLADLRIIYHYQHDHPDSEVFVARLSPKFAARADQMPTSRLNHGRVVATCYFCEEKKDMSRFGWGDHIMMHTGEPNEQCLSCNKKYIRYRQHDCKSKGVSLFEYKLSNSNQMLDAFICKKCNYVQIQEANMRRHIESQHQIGDIQLRQFYKKIHLVSAK